jgi:hypothetical protein
MRRFVPGLAALLLLSAAPAVAQQPAPQAAPAATLSVFLDCQNVYCDEDYVRTEIKAVNWVRDRQVSDVHVLVTGQDTGAGGREFTLTFLGLRLYSGVTDTLKFILPPSFTDDERRVGLVRFLRIGLVRYVARTPAADKVTITLGNATATSAQTSTKTDKWKAWVFRTGADGGAFGEETYFDYRINARFNASRVTELWKTQFGARQSYNQSEFEIDDTTTAVNIRRNYSANLTQVRSMTPHMSIGLRADFFSSTYENTKRQFRVAPAIEYNVFPYSQSTRRVWKFEYAVGISDNSYADTTIYDEVHELLPLHRLSMGIAARQPWGSVDASINATQYLHDPSKYRVGSFVGTNLRLFKGFEVYTYGGYDIIYDQLSLAKKDYTPQQILLRQFQRGTTYSFWLDLGLSYTFGSIFNNVVNPRFD